MNSINPSLVLQHSTGPIRWVPAGTLHRAIIDKRVIVVDDGRPRELIADRTTRFLNPTIAHVDFTDPVIFELSTRFSGLRALTDGGLWEGLLTSIIGQAVSLHSAAAFQRRLCVMLSPGIVWQGREFRALPSPACVAECSLDQVRAIGLTTRRAQGLIDVAREVLAGNVIPPEGGDIDLWMRDLTQLPMVGPWTAASALLWGVGHLDVYPKGDVALLRAARLAYDDPAMTMRDLDRLSEGWRPQRAIAARLLWTNLLGMGWDDV